MKFFDYKARAKRLEGQVDTWRKTFWSSVERIQSLEKELEMFKKKDYNFPASHGGATRLPLEAAYEKRMAELMKGDEELKDFPLYTVPSGTNTVKGAVGTHSSEGEVVYPPPFEAWNKPRKSDVSLEIEKLKWDLIPLLERIADALEEIAYP